MGESVNRWIGESVIGIGIGIAIAIAIGIAIGIGIEAPTRHLIHS